MASIAKAIADVGINATLGWLSYLEGELTSVNHRLCQGEASEADWETAATRLNGAIFQAAIDHTIDGVGNWPAWLAFQLGNWIGEGWGETDQWMHKLNALIYQMEHLLINDYSEVVPGVAGLLASNIIAFGQEGFTVMLTDQPAAMLYELGSIILGHADLHKEVMVELTEGRYGLRHVVVPVPAPAPASAPAPAPAPAPVPARFSTEEDQRIADTLRGLLSEIAQSKGKVAKIHAIIAVYEFIWTIPEFLRRHLNVTYTTLTETSKFYYCADDRWWFNNVEGALSCDVLLIRTLETFTGGAVAEHMPVLVRSHFRHHAHEHPVGKYFSILGAEHIDNLCGHAVRFTPTLAKITTSRRLRSGRLTAPRPVVMPNHVHTSETHEIVVIAEYDGPRTPPSTPPVAAHPFFGGGRPELGGDGGDEPTDPRPLIVYDSFLDNLDEFAAPAPSRSPSPCAEEFEEIVYDSDSDGNVFEDCDSDGIWEQVEAHHRDARLGLIE